MNLRERIQLRAVINLIINIIERLVSIFERVQKGTFPKPKIDTPIKPNRHRPLKKIVDTIDNIVPLPWRDKDE